MVTAVKQRAERRRELDRETSIENHQHQTRTTRRLMRSIETESNAPTMISDYLTDRSIFFTSASSRPTACLSNRYRCVITEVPALGFQQRVPKTPHTWTIVNNVDFNIYIIKFQLIFCRREKIYVNTTLFLYLITVLINRTLDIIAVYKNLSKLLTIVQY